MPQPYNTKSSLTSQQQQQLLQHQSLGNKQLQTTYLNLNNNTSTTISRETLTYLLHQL